MILSRFLLAPLLALLLLLVSCKPSLDKPSASASDVSKDAAPAALATASSPAEKPAPVQPSGNILQASTSGDYSLLMVQLPAEKGKKVEVLEFFAYFCNHCKSFDPALSAWAKKNSDRVTFKRVPVAFRDSMIPQQQMFYALEAMGKLNGLHEKVFHAVQVDRISLNTEAEIIDFVGKNGVDKDKFKDLFTSFSIQSLAKNASNLQAAYKIDGVPSIGIDGRFVTSATHALKRAGVVQSEVGGQTATLQIMDELVSKVLKDRSAAAKPGK